MSKQEARTGGVDVLEKEQPFKKRRKHQRLSHKENQYLYLIQQSYGGPYYQDHELDYFADFWE